MSSWVTTLTVSPDATLFFCERFSGEEKGNVVGEVGVNGPDALEGDGLMGKGIDEDLTATFPSRPGVSASGGVAEVEGSKG